jgi:anti-sigma-K factor RskA
MTEHPTDDLGLHALGLLDAGEREAIEQHLATCEACRDELAAHRATVAALGEAVAAAPRSELRERIVGHHAGFRLPLLQLAPAASILLTIALVVSLAALSQERAMRDAYGQALAVLANGGRVVPLDAKPDAGQRGAIVLSRDGASYLVLQLPPPPAGMAYEAWIIRDGVASPAGMAPTLSGVITMQLHDALRPGDTAAVTLEDAAGAKQPTGAPLLIGHV